MTRLNHQPPRLLVNFLVLSLCFSLTSLWGLWEQTSFAEEINQETKKPSKYIGVSTTYAFFSSQAINLEDLEYDIDPKLLTSVEGNFRITKKLRGLLNVNFDSTELKNTFQFFGAIAGKNTVVQFTGGKFTGDASLTSSAAGTALVFNQETETKYFSADLLFRAEAQWMKSFFNCEGTCYHGLRFVNYQLPGEILTAGRFGAGNNIDDAPSFLDPEFEVKGVMYMIAANTLRDFVLRDTPEDLNTTSSKEENNVSEKKVQNESPPPVSKQKIAVVASFGIGYGRGTVSDQGKANILNTTGKTLEDDTKNFILWDTVLGIYRTWDWSKGNARYVLGLGYLAHANFALDPDLSSDIFENPDDPNQVRFSNVGIGYFFHGPSISFFGSF